MARPEAIQPTQTANNPYAGSAGGSLAGSLIGGLFNLVGAGINYGVQQQTNMKNEELLRESWARDDSQMQRARRDAEAAGFSPLAALGNMPGNTNPTTMQAPQLDTSGISNSIEGALNRHQAYEAMRQQQKLIDAQVKGAEEETRGKGLDNDLKEQTFNTKVMQEVAALNELRKKNDITDAQYWAYLSDMKARGMSNEFINTMIAQKEAGYDATKQTAEKIITDKLTTKEIEKIEADINKIKSEKNILEEQYNQWKGENGYWANELKKLKEEVTKAKNTNGNLELSRSLPTVTIGDYKVLGRTVKTESELRNYMTEIATKMLAQTSEKQAEITQIIKENPFLGAMEYVFGGGNGTSILNMISGMLK